MNKAQSKSKLTKVLSLILALVMVLSLMPLMGAASTTAGDNTASDSSDSFYRILHLDCGRKYFTEDWIIALLYEMKADGYNQLELAFGNDGLRFLLDNMSFMANGTTYTYDTIKTKVEAGNKAQNSSNDGRWLTEAQMGKIIAKANELGIEIVPLLNLPGHANTILDIADDAYNAAVGNTKSQNTLGVTNENAQNFAYEIFKKYVDYFAEKGCKYFNFGADEYCNDVNGTPHFDVLSGTGYQKLSAFINKLAQYIVDKNMTPRTFNDALYYNSWDMDTTTNTAITKIQCCYWSCGWDSYNVASANTISTKQHSMINTHGDYYYVAGNADDQANLTANAANFSNTVFAGDDQKIDSPVGSMFCIWCDNPTAETETQIAQHVRLAMRAMALRMQDQSTDNMDTSVVSNGFNADGSINSASSTDDKSTDTGDTEVKTYDVTVTVGQTATKTVDGDVRTDVDDTALNKSIATYSTKYNNETTEATTTRGEKVAPSANLTNVVISTSEADSNGNYYYLLLDPDGEISDTTKIEDATKFTVKTQTNWGSVKYALVANNGRCLRGNNSLDSDTSTYYSFYYNENYGFYYRYQNSNKTIVYSSGKWTVGNTSSTDKGYLYSVTTTPGKTVDETTITFKGEAVGETKVTIGGVTYNINVIAEDLSKVTPLTVEYWITNTRVESVAGKDDTSVGITAQSAYKENGVKLSDLVLASGVREDQNDKVVFWKGTCLTSENKQTTDGGDDKTTKGTDFTYIRYWDGKWSFSADGASWTDFNTDDNKTVTDQVVAYYLQATTVTDEITTEVVDWGPSRESYSESNFVIVDYAVKYQSSNTRNPSSFPTDKTIAFHCNYSSDLNKTVFKDSNNSYYRRIGAVYAVETAQYEVYMITLTPSSGTTGSTASASESYTYNYDNEKVIWVDDEKNLGDFTDESKHYTSISTDDEKKFGYTVGGEPVVPALEIYNKQGMLVTYYLRAKATEDSLTVNYYEEGKTEPFYSYNIAVKSGTTFNSNIALPNTEKQLGNLTNGSVTNYNGKSETVTSDLKQLTQIGAQYRYSSYECKSLTKSEDLKTINLYYSFDNTKTFVVDFGLKLEITPEAVNSDLSGRVTNVEVTQKIGDYGTVDVKNTSADGYKVVYTMNKAISGEESFNITYTGYNTTTKKEDSVTWKVNIIPATSVYYEDSFATFTDGSDAKWTTETDGVAQTSTTQALEALGSKTKVYGTDNAYSNSTKYSMGSAHKVTVTSDMASTEGVTWPTATFTFTGTGFDIISLTDNNSGAIYVDVYSGSTATGTPVKRLVVNNYYGYIYDSVAKTWNVSSSDTNNALYQIPVMKVSGLNHGTYTAVITVAYASRQDKTNDSGYSFWLDAIRVYDPIGKDVVTYSQDGEGYPKYIKLHDELVKTTSTTDSTIVDTTNKVFFIDGAAQANVATYANYGPNNEVYLANGQAITFKINSDSNIASIQIGAKAPSGTANLVVNNEKVQENLSTATEMYYDITSYAKNENQVEISNNGDGILSLTNLKITYKEDPSATTASDSSENPVMLTSLSDEEVNTAVMSVRALFAAPVVETFEPETFEASWNSVRKGQTATLTVKTSEDVDLIMVDGVAVTEYTTHTERNGFGRWAEKVTYRVFTYQVTAEESGDHEIIAFNEAGAESDAITATLTVKESGSSWWSNLWNNFFGRWF